MGEFCKLGTKAEPTIQVPIGRAPPGGSSNPKSGPTILIPTARSCALTSRCAWFPGHITAFHTFCGLCMPLSVCGAAAPHARACRGVWLVLRRCWSVRCGADMADTLLALSSSVTMSHTASRSLVAEWHIVTFLWLNFCSSGQWQRQGTAIAKMHISQSWLLRKDGSMSAVALGVGHDSLTHRGWHRSSTAICVRTLRQSYITPHCMKCRSSHSQAHFVSLHRFAPLGFTQQALCKIAYAEAVASRLHFPVASRPTCSRLSPWRCAGVVAQVRRFAHSSG